MNQEKQKESKTLRTIGWQELFKESEGMESDLDFYSLELNFLGNLYEKYLMPLTRKESLDHLQLQMAVLSKLTKENVRLAKELDLLIKDLELLMEKAFLDTENGFLKKHQKFRLELREFIYGYKEFKLGSFNIFEHLLESQKMQHLLKAE
jgi:hypothetical protein